MHKILMVDDEKAILTFLEVFLMQTGGFEVKSLSDSKEAFTVIDSFGPDVLLLDMDMPDVTGIQILEHLAETPNVPEIIVLSGVEDIELAVKAMKLGAFDYLTKPVDGDKLLDTIGRALDRRVLKTEVKSLTTDMEDRVKTDPFAPIVTRSPQMATVFDYLRTIAPSENPVLVWGESGTGKELLARAIHKLSRRRDKPFVAVNAGVFASELFASEFFGHTKGAFTGADKSQEGFLGKADGGTLFLDEIGELSLTIQVKLLRVLQDGEYFQVGSSKRRTVDLRIITATNKDLKEEIQQGGFRADLFYRLNVCSVKVPPLRERDGDIPFLAQFFLEKYCARHGKKLKGIAECVLGLLERYRYPGNVRELENIINNAVLMERTNELGKRALPQYFLDATLNAPYTISNAHLKSMAEVEKEHLERVLTHTKGNRTKTSKILGISRQSLINKIKSYGIDK